GYAYWQTQFGGGAGVIGQQLRIDRIQATIIGVAPEGFVGMADQGVPAAFLPITHYAFSFRGPNYPRNYNWSWLEIIGRRRPGVSPVEARSDLTAAFQQSWRAQYSADPGWGGVEVVQPRGELGPVQLGRGPDAGRDSRVALWTSGVALIVLLVACANVANLLLSRALSRRREIAMRLALGVGRARLARQLLTESLVLAALGGAAGLLIAQWGAATLRTLFLPGDEASGVLTDGRTLAFAGLATLGAALLTGLVPAFHSGRANLAATLKAGAREGTYRRSRTRTALLVFQAALSVILLVGAGLFVRSLENVRGYRLGYDVDLVLFAAANARGVSIDPTAQQGLNDRMLAAAQSLPGVTRAAVAMSVPFWSNESRGLWVPGVDSVRNRGRFLMQAGSADYFATMGTRMLLGRAFDETDQAGTPRVMVVSEGMARALWPGRDPIGQCVRIGEENAPCTSVVGVSEEMRLRSLADAREFTYHLPLTQLDEPSYPQLLVRVAGRPEDHVAALRRVLQAEMPGAAYVNVVPLSRLVDPNLRAWRFGATVFVAFGVLALVLAAIGLYSLITFDVAQRRQEFGVRLALGASAGQVMRLIVGGGLRLVGLGVVAGGAIALWAAPWLEAVLFEQSPRDPLVFGIVAAVLLGVAIMASVAPARRASHVDPSVTLRGD
ncbi:MAG TPA: FtsX-like permease family protein, partial [Gemmatimonadaceae bacterium]|nr:FtsX-like permease family protein [Gemmatimonadaceae bacterium]